MKDELTILGVKITTLIAGFIGALISLSFYKEPYKSKKEHFFRNTIKLLGGTACATFVTPLALVYHELPQELESALSFIIGIIGMNLASWLFQKTQKGWKFSDK